MSVDTGILDGTFPIEQQRTFNVYIAELLGLDFESGRIDVSTHPFTTSFHSHDVRITTRYNEHDVLHGILSTIHETGHALYNQGIRSEHFGTPLGESISPSIHESQSKIWETMVGKGKPLWIFLYPKLQNVFPEVFAHVSFKDFYCAINRVKPSLIRLEADEITYHLHVILRFEIEKALIEGKFEVEDLPRVWNTKTKEYLGIIVPDDRQGILQDMHWSVGSIGYFPTYTLGTLYAAQFYHQAKKDIPELEKQITLGNPKPLREWLRENIHQHGKYYTASDLIKEVTGEKLNSNYFINYIKQKYTDLYNLRG